MNLDLKDALRIRSVRVIHLVGRGFKEDNLTLHASALTYTTLISLVPFLAFLISILKGFGGGERSLAAFHDWAAEMPEGIQTVVEQMITLVDNTNFLALGGSAVAFLFFTVIKMLGSIEGSFNQIWGVANDRSLFRKITDYISTLVVVLLFILSAATFRIEQLTSHLGVFSGLAYWATSFIPLISTWIAFTFLYAFMPNTRVKFLPAILGGLLGAVLWIGWLEFFQWAQIGVFRYNQIFGTFAAIPIFLFWLYVCWVIVLVGVVASFAFQNTRTFEQETAASKASMEARLKVALGILTECANSLAGNAPPFNHQDFAREHGVSIRLINRVLQLLTQQKFVAELHEPEGAYVLTRDPDLITLQEVVSAVFSDGVQPETLGVHGINSSVDRALQTMKDVVEEGTKHLTIQQLMENTNEETSGN